MQLNLHRLEPNASLLGAASLTLIRLSLLLLGLLLPINLGDSIPAVSDEKRFGWSVAPGTSSDEGVLIINRTMRHGYTYGALTGDRLLRINGVAADSQGVTNLREHSVAGDTVVLSVERAGGEVELRIPVADNSVSYSGYFWYRLATALVGWCIGMLLLIRRGSRPEALALGAVLLLLTPVTVASGAHAENLFLLLARTGWQLQAAAHRCFLPALLLHFLVLATGRPRWLRRPRIWVGIYSVLFATLALITDGFSAPMAWGKFGIERDLRTWVGLGFELLALVVSWWISCTRQGLPLSVRWICYTTLLVAITGTLRASLGLVVGEAQVPEFFWRLHGLVLIMLPASATLYLAVPRETIESGLAERRRLTYWITTMLTGLYGLVITAAAAVVLSSIGRSLSGAEWLLFGSIFVAAIVFSPILRWSWEFVDRRMFSRWVELEAASQQLVQRLHAELEPVEIARHVADEVPRLLGASSATLILDQDPTSYATQVEGPGYDTLPPPAFRAEIERAPGPGETTLIPIEHPDGTLLGALRLEIAADDIQLDAASYAVARSLAQRIAFVLRNAESYLELRQAQQDLAESERIASLGALAGGLAHEIKNPLAGLKMGLYLLERDGTDPRKLQRIQRDLRRIDDLVSGLLRFTHDGVREEQAAIELRSFLRECTDDLQPFAEDREIQLLLEQVHEELRVRASPSQLRVLLSSLLRNALDAAGYGGAVRVVTTTQGAEIAIDIHDSGPGIPAGLEERIFEFTFSTKPGGTGLGLALARREAEHLGGRIEIVPATNAAAGAGTLLRVVLPRAI